MGSSGIQVTERVAHRECGAMIEHTFPVFSDGPKFYLEWPCTFKGEVEEWADPETVTAGWTCPTCGTEHDTSREVFL